MNKEESIQKIQDQIEKVKEYIEYGMPYGEYLQLQLAFEDIVNLIEKQSKEIEEYKKQLDLDYVDKHFVPIERYNQLEKEIEELKNEVMEKELIINGLKEDRRIAVEEIQEQYYISKDKIKAKIEECEKEKNIPHEMDFKAFYRIKDLKNIEIKVLQSLLDKE